MSIIGVEPISPETTGFKPVVFTNFTIPTDGLTETRTQTARLKV